MDPATSWTGGGRAVSGAPAGESPRPAALLLGLLLLRVGRADRQLAAEHGARGVCAIVVLNQQGPGRVRRLLVPEPLQQVQAFLGRERPGERRRDPRCADQRRRVAVEQGELPRAAVEGPAVVVAWT